MNEYKRFVGYTNEIIVNGMKYVSCWVVQTDVCGGGVVVWCYVCMQTVNGSSVEMRPSLFTTGITIPRASNWMLLKHNKRFLIIWVELTKEANSRHEWEPERGKFVVLDYITCSLATSKILLWGWGIGIDCNDNREFSCHSEISKRNSLSANWLDTITKRWRSSEK